MWSSFWHKEWRLWREGGGLWLLALLWLVFSLFCLFYWQQYQEIALELASLSNRRGATEMLLKPLVALTQWLTIFWGLYFGTRSLALEKQWQTTALLRGMIVAKHRTLQAKIAVVLLSSALLWLPLWLFCALLSPYVNWDKKLLLSFFILQTTVIMYSGLLAIAVSALFSQAISAALTLTLTWFLLWALPLVVNNPQILLELARWLSPFAHFQLLISGILSVQTIIFLLLHVIFFLSFIYLFWTEE